MSARPPPNFRKMTRDELLSYSVQNKLTPIGTGKDGLVLKLDLLKVCMEHYEQTRQAHSKQVEANIHSIFSTINGQLELYNIEKSGLIFRLEQIIQVVLARISCGEIIQPDIAAKLMYECDQFKDHIPTYNQIRPILHKIITDGTLL